jgi:hypothetical protein
MYRIRSSKPLVALLLGLCVSWISRGLAASEGRGDAFIGWKEKEGPFFVITTSFGKVSGMAPQDTGCEHVTTWLSYVSLQIRLRPRADLSPKIVELVSAVARKDKQEQKLLNFYRHEPVPDVGRPPACLLCCPNTMLEPLQDCALLVLCRTGARMDTGGLHTGVPHMAQPTEVLSCTCTVKNPSSSDACPLHCLQSTTRELG